MELAQKRLNLISNILFQIKYWPKKTNYTNVNLEK